MGRFGTVRRHLGDACVYPNKLHPSVLRGSYLIEDWNYPPDATQADGLTLPTGASGQLDYLRTRNGSYLYVPKGVSTTLAPTIDATNGGLDAALQAAAGKGCEYVPGIMQTNRNPLSMTVGSNAASFYGSGKLGDARFIKAQFVIATVANAAECIVGFRKAEAQQANLSGYNMVAGLTAELGVINRYTIFNGGAAVLTNTTRTATNATLFTLEVRVVGRRVQFFVNGVRVENAATPYDFNVGEVLIPFIRLDQGVGATQIRIQFLETGRLADIIDGLTAVDG